MAKNRFFSSYYFHTKSEFKMSNKQLLLFSHNFSFHGQTSGNNTCVYIVSKFCILERRICIVSASLFACLWLCSREGKVERTDLDARIKQKEGEIELNLCDIKILNRSFWCNRLEIYNISNSTLKFAVSNNHLSKIRNYEIKLLQML